MLRNPMIEHEEKQGGLWIMNRYGHVLFESEINTWTFREWEKTAWKNRHSLDKLNWVN